MNTTITLELSMVKMIKDLRDEQKRFFQLTVDAKKSNLPQLWAERKKCLESCRQLESLVDSHLDRILSGVGMSADEALKLIKEQLNGKEVANG